MEDFRKILQAVESVRVNKLSLYERTLPFRKVDDTYSNVGLAARQILNILKMNQIYFGQVNLVFDLVHYLIRVSRPSDLALSEQLTSEQREELLALFAKSFALYQEETTHPQDAISHPDTHMGNEALDKAN